MSMGHPVDHYKTIKKTDLVHQTIPVAANIEDALTQTERIENSYVLCID